MRWKTFLLVPTVVIVSIGLVVGLHVLTVINTGYEGDGFRRIFTPGPLLSMRSIDLGYNSYYFAGMAKTTIYLGNSTAPFVLLGIDKDLRGQQNRLQLKIDTVRSFPRGSTMVAVDSPYYYIFNGIVPFIYRGKLYDGKATDLKQDSVFFKQAILAGKDVFAFRSFNGHLKRDVVIKKALKGPANLDTDILQKQIDGVFCTDGMLHYSDALQALVHVYYYRNQFTITDIGLNHTVRRQTIDTTSKARVRIAQVLSDSITTMASPPVVVNEHSAIDGRWLYVHSGMLSDEEDRRHFASFDTIDLYTLPDGKYVTSFYLPAFEDQHINSFYVGDNILAALYDRYLVVYALSPSIFLPAL